MNEEKENKIIIPDGDSFEDIGAPLTAGTSFTLAGESGFSNRGLTSSSTRLYVLWRNASNAYKIRAYTLTGTYQTTEDITVVAPTRPTELSANYTGYFLNDLDFSGNKFYILVSWSGTGQPRRVSLARYSNTGTFEANIWVQPTTYSIQNIADLDIYGSSIVFAGFNGWIRHTFTSSSVGAQQASNTFVSSDNVAISATRIYLFRPPNLRAFDYSGNRVTADDTVAGDTIYGDQAATISGSTYYAFNRSNVVNTFTGVPVPTPTYSATWGTPSYNSGSRAISATLTLSEDPGASFSATNDFVVRGGSPEADQTNWSFTSTGTGTTRVITATPASTVGAGTYKIRLKEDAFGTDKPSAATDTTGQAITATPTITYQSRTEFTLPAGWPSSRIHGNFTDDDTYFYFGYGLSLLAYTKDGLTRTSSADITLTSSSFGGLPVMTSTDQHWGLDRDADGNWLVLVRKAGTTSGFTRIAIIYIFNSSGTQTGAIAVPATISTVPGETFRAPKGVFHFGTMYYTRVVRSVAGSLRVLIYDSSTSTWTSALSNQSANVRLSDMSGRQNLIGILQQAGPVHLYVYNTDMEEQANLSTSLDANNTQPWAMTIRGNTVYIADRGGYIYQYADWPETTYVAPTVSAITVTGDTLPSTNQTGSTVTATITFSNSIPATELTSADFTLSNTAASIAITETTGNHSTFNLTITQPTNSSGTYTVSLNANAISAGTGYGAGPATAYSLGTVTFDTRFRLGITWSGEATNTVTSSTTTATLTFSQNIPATELTTSDFTSSNSAVTITGVSPTTGNANAYTITFTHPSNSSGSYTISLNANAIPAGTTYLASPAAAVASDSISFDTRSAVTVSSDTLPSTSQTAATVGATITFNRSVTGLTASDFTLTGGATIAVTGEGGTRATWTLTITQPTNSSGTYTVSLNANAIPTSTTYLQGPTSAYSLGTVTYDTRSALSASWSNVATSTVRTGTSTATLTFGANVPATQLTTSDFTSSNSAVTITGVSPTTGNASAYTITFSHPSNSSGSYIITLNASAIPAGTTYLASPSASVSTSSIAFDTRTAVTVSADTLPSTAQGATTTATITFDRSVTGLTSGDFTLSDTNASIAVSGTGATYNLTLTNPTNASGSYTVQLNANAIPVSTTYLAGPTAAYSLGTVTYDTRSAVAVSSFTAPAGTQTGGTSTFVLTLDRSVTKNEVTTTDFSTSNSSATLSSVTGRGTTSNASVFDVVVNNPSGTQGTYTVTFAQNAIPARTGASGYLQGPASAFTSGSVTYDRRVLTAVGVTSFTAPGTTQTGTSSVFRLTLNQSVPTGQITTSDFSGATITGVAAVSPSSGSATTYDITATNPSPASGRYRLTLSQNAVAATNDYLAGPTAAVNSAYVNYDTRADLTASWTTVPTGTQGSSSAFIVTFSHSVPAAQLTSADITVSNSASFAITPTSGSQTAYTVTVTNPANSMGSYTVSLAANAIAAGTTYKAGPSSAVTTSSVAFDTRSAITASWSNVPTGTQTSSTATATLTFGQSIPANQLTTNDFTSSNSAVTITGVSPTTGSQTAYTITFTHPSSGNGSYTISLNRNAVASGTNYLQGPSAAVTTSSIAFDTRTAVTVSSDTLPTGEQTGATFTATITFDRSVTGLTNSDFTLTNGATVAISGSGATYTLTITQPTNYDGNYTVTLNANAIPSTNTYLAGPTSAYSLGTVDCDTRTAVSVSTFTAPGGTQTGVSSIFVLTLDRAVPKTEITSADFSGATISSVTGQGAATTATVFNVVATNPTNAQGTYRLTLRQNAVTATTGANSYKTGPTSAQQSGQVSYDTRVLTAVSVSSFTAPATTQTGTSSVFRLTLDRAVPTGQITTGDFSGATITGVSAVSPSSGSASTYDITATNPSLASGRYRLTLSQNAVAATSNYQAGPTSAVNSAYVNYDTRQDLTASWTTVPTGTQGASSSFIVTFSHSVPASQLTSADITVSNGASFAITPTSGSQTAYTIRVTNPTHSMGTYTVSLAADAIAGGTTYKAGPSSAVTTSSVAFDTRAAINASWSGVPTQTETGSSVSLTLTFTRDIDATQLTNTDFTVSGGASISSTSPTTGTEDAFTIVVDQPTTGNGSYTVTLNANAIPNGTTYLAGPSSAVATSAIAYDRRNRVGVTSFTAPTGTQSGASSAFVLTMNRAVPKTQVTSADFSGATISSVTGRGGATTATIFDVVATNPTTARGTYRLTLAANAVEATSNYLAGPLNSFQSTPVTYDTRTQLTADWTEPTGEQTSATSSFTLTFNVSVSGLTTSDFTITAGTVTNVSGTGTTYTVTVTNPTDSAGSYILTLKQDAIADGTSYKALTAAVASESVSYNTRSQVSASWTVPTGTQGATSIFTLTFDRSVPRSELTSADITVSNSANFTIAPSSGSQAVYTITVTNPANSMGSYTVSLAANAIPATSSYLAGPSSAVTTTSVAFETRSAVTVTADTLPADEQTAATVSATITFDRSVSGLTASDFTLSNNDASISVTGEGGTRSTWSLTITQPEHFDGTYTVSLNADAIPTTSTYLAGPENAYSLGTINCDTRQIIGASWSNVPTVTSTIVRQHLTLNFTRDIDNTQITTNDFTINQITGTGARIHSITYSVNDRDYGLTIAQSPGSNGSYTVSLNANAIPDGTDYLAGPATAVTTGTITYRVEALTATFGFPEDSEGETITNFSGEFDVDLTLTSDNDEILPSDFRILTDADGTEAMGWQVIPSVSSAMAGTPIAVRFIPPRGTRGYFRMEFESVADQPDGDTDRYFFVDNYTVTWRQKILDHIEAQVCSSLLIPLIDDPDHIGIPTRLIRPKYENQRNPELDRLRFAGEMDNKSAGAIITIPLDQVPHSTLKGYNAPPEPNNGRRTAARYFFSRPIKNEDVTAISGDKCRTPAIFLQVIGGQQDTSGSTAVGSPGIPSMGREKALDDQIEYFQFIISCVIRDESYDPATGFSGNGKAWYDAITSCMDPADIPDVMINNRPYRARYWPTFNEQAVGFITDIQEIIDLTYIMSVEIEDSNAFIANTFWGDWAMLPGSQNSPTDTVGIPLIVEVRYPKNP